MTGFIRSANVTPNSPTSRDYSDFVKALGLGELNRSGEGNPYSGVVGGF
ncbi:hypothetical protein RRSWK_03998 [Rhodopirellula sp. SWK7]|nr:hypothetical protein RRSWK_03998 [Rhodopirellula sp. SWK7]